MGDVLAFTGFAQSVTLDSLRKYNRWRTCVLDCHFECRVNFDWVMPAKPQARELIVGEMLDHSEQPGIAAEQALPEVGAAFDEEFLILAVGDLAEPPHQQPIAVILDQAVPVAAPDDLDDIPARTAEMRLQLLNDLPVASARPIEPLQVAVDDPDQVVELFAGGQSNRAERLGLIHLAITEKRPHLAACAGFKSAVFQIFDKTGVIDGLNWA